MLPFPIECRFHCISDWKTLFVYTDLNSCHEKYYWCNTVAVDTEDDVRPSSIVIPGKLGVFITLVYALVESRNREPGLVHIILHEAQS